jgi:Tfp pilus assembly protein PilN|tara:strand:- start:1035 stop:1256 length:222 start_codon:yes stop_codon:yes gene_type:complete
MVEFIAQWIGAPLVFVVWFLFMKSTKNERDIAVLQAQQEANRLAYDREIKEIKETIKAIFNKLDSIEQALRER